MSFTLFLFHFSLKGSRVAIKKVVKKKVDLNKKLLWEIKQVSTYQERIFKNNLSCLSYQSQNVFHLNLPAQIYVKSVQVIRLSLIFV